MDTLCIGRRPREMLPCPTHGGKVHYRRYGGLAMTLCVSTYSIMFASVGMFGNTKFNCPELYAVTESLSQDAKQLKGSIDSYNAKIEEGEQEKYQRLRFLVNNEKEDASRSGSADNHSGDHFSACVLWMDDNHRLEEWLGYHYYVMKLRYVVMNIDPKSKTSPQAILDRWNDHDNQYNLNMTIVTFTDKDYILDYDYKMQAIENTQRSLQVGGLSEAEQTRKLGKMKTRYHIHRQNEFYRFCSRHLVERNKSWTSYHDNDEFITFKASSKNDSNITKDGIRKMEQPGYILQRLNSLKNRFAPHKSGNETSISCLFVDRKRVCAKELGQEETNQLISQNNGIIPDDFINKMKEKAHGNSKTYNDQKDQETILQRFHTLRFKFLAPLNDPMPKSFIDLSQEDPKRYAMNSGNKFGTHIVMGDLCVQERKHRIEELQKLVNSEHFSVHHYLGDWAAYSYRPDARRGNIRNYQVWKERANWTSGEYSHVVRPWLKGFVKLVGGTDAASYLLQGAGRYPKGYNATTKIEEYWEDGTFIPGKEIQKYMQIQERKRKRNRISTESSN